MVQGPTDPVRGIPFLPGVAARGGLRADAEAESGEPGAFTLPADDASPVSDGPSPALPPAPATDGGPALLLEMSGDVIARARLLDGTAAPATTGTPVADAGGDLPAAAAAEAARRAYSQIAVPPAPADHGGTAVPVRSADPRPDIGDTQAAALFRPTPPRPVPSPAGALRSRQPSRRLRPLTAVLLALAGILVFLLVFVALTR